MHSDLLGFLDCLLHEETLLLSGISGESGELVKLDAVLEGQPRLHAKAFVRLTSHTNPWVLGVHLVYNLVQLPLCLTIKQWNCLYAFGSPLQRAGVRP